jgi:tRNA-dihydrouridine synthase 3
MSPVDVEASHALTQAHMDHAAGHVLAPRDEIAQSRFIVTSAEKLADDLDTGAGGVGHQGATGDGARDMNTIGPQIDQLILGKPWRRRQQQAKGQRTGRRVAWRTLAHADRGVTLLRLQWTARAYVIEDRGSIGWTDDLCQTEDITARSSNVRAMTLAQILSGAVVMAPMTKGSNLPYRQLCVEQGARVLVSEMVVARRLKQKRKSEFALIRRFPDEPTFGVQLAGTNPDEMAWAAALVEARGADFVDVNLGCPIDHFTRKGLGAAMARQPKRVRRVVEAMARAVERVPITVKIRLGWNDELRNYVDVARAAVDAGARAIFVHGRTRNARYRRAADWDAIGEVVRAVDVPVVGNGDLLLPHEVEAARAKSGCAGVMVARGALIKPWIFREFADGYRDVEADARLELYRRYTTLALAHWRDDERGRSRVHEFLVWHLGFWCRYAKRRADGGWPGMQEREPVRADLTPLERLLARTDSVAHAWIAGRLLAGASVTAEEAPPETVTGQQEYAEAEG